jgi:hypothetical protein
MIGIDSSPTSEKLFLLELALNFDKIPNCPSMFQGY